MNIVLIGIQGSGKGSLILGLQDIYDFSLISTGQLLRDEAESGSKLGQAIKEAQNAGKLVRLDIVIDTIKKKLATVDKSMVIFDGFPRSKEQADELDKIANIDLVIYLHLSRSKAMERILNRLVCSKCSYITKKSAVDSMVCEKCGGELKQRSDDNIETVTKRFEQYNNETEPLLDIYRERGVFVRVNADKPLAEVVQDVVKVINEYNNKK